MLNHNAQLYSFQNKVHFIQFTIICNLLPIIRQLFHAVWVTFCKFWCEKLSMNSNLVVIRVRPPYLNVLLWLKKKKKCFGVRSGMVGEHTCNFFFLCCMKHYVTMKNVFPINKHRALFNQTFTDTLQLLDV